MFHKPNFLTYPERDNKTRSKGYTSILDAGLSYDHLKAIIESFDYIIDFVKFGWGTTLVTPCIDDKIQLLHQYNIDYWFGGTLFEIAYAQDKIGDYIRWAKSKDCKYIEVSDGSLNIPKQEKLYWIGSLSEDFHVLSEVGSKDIEIVMSPSEWVSQINEELTHGAWKIIAEGRESGESGIYRQSGEIRYGLIKELQQENIEFNDIFFEAPIKKQQSWFIQNINNNVNLSNISPYDLISLETLRLGLRNDTIDLMCGNTA